MENRDDGVDVQLRRGGNRRFDMVIGADGLQSTVRRLAFEPHDYLEKRLGYGVAAFEVAGYGPRATRTYTSSKASPAVELAALCHAVDESAPGLFFFAGDVADHPAGMLDLVAQKTILRRRFGDGGWETSRILDELDRIREVYFDRVSQIVMRRW